MEESRRPQPRTSVPVVLAGWSWMEQQITIEIDRAKVLLCRLEDTMFSDMEQGRELRVNVLASKRCPFILVLT